MSFSITTQCLLSFFKLIVKTVLYNKTSAYLSDKYPFWYIPGCAFAFSSPCHMGVHHHTEFGAAGVTRVWHGSSVHEHYFSAIDLMTRDWWYHSGHAGLLPWTVSFELLSLQVEGKPELLSRNFLSANLWYFLMLRVFFCFGFGFGFVVCLFVCFSPATHMDYFISVWFNVIIYFSFIK